MDGRPARLFCFVSHVGKQGNDTGAEVALDDDLAVFDGTSNTALGLQDFAEGVEVVIGTNEVVYDGHSLATTAAALHANMEFLLGGRQSFETFFFAFVFILIVGVGGIDDTDFIFVFGHSFFYLVNSF